MSRSTLPLFPAFVALAVTASAAAAQGNLGTRLQELRRATAHGEHARALLLADSLARALPDHPEVVLARAITRAAAGRSDEAADDVRRLLRWDARFARRALRDSALVGVRDRFDAGLVAQLAEAADRPMARARAWAVLGERDLVPEGTAWDPATRSVLVGSLNKAKVVAIAEDGSASDRVAAGSNGLASVVGIHVDAIRGVLWVASNARYDHPDDARPSLLFAFDAARGSFIAHHAAPTPGPHFFNDITTAPDGTVYVTDSRAGAVWRLRPGAPAWSPSRLRAVCNDRTASPCAAMALTCSSPTPITFA